MTKPTTLGTLALAGLALLVAGCAENTAEPPPAAVGSAEAGKPWWTPGHRRMLHELERVAARSRGENPFVGQGLATRLRNDLQATSPTDVPLRWLIHVELGHQELRMGNQQLALDHYHEAYRLLDEARDPAPLDKRLRTAFELGTAYMRFGERRNCVAMHTSDSCIFPIGGRGVHADKQGSETAVGYFMEVLERAAPNSWLHVKARWLLNIAHMTLGTWPEGVPAALRIEPEVFASDEPFPSFVEIAPRLGLNTMDLAGGAAAEDFDGDGFLDILVSTSDPGGQLRLFRNNGDGTFTERTEPAGLTGIVGGLNLTCADYDNDSYVDVYVLRGAWWRQWGDHPNSLLHNNGDGTFTDVTFEAGLGEHHYPTQTAAWADYDNDGDLDLYVGNETDLQMNPEVDFGFTRGSRPFNVRAPCQLFRNNGDGTFTDVAAAAGVENLRFTKAVAWADYDGDRFPDLYVSNMGDRNRMYHNNGDGTFTDVARALDLERPFASFVVWFWDVNHDGGLDLFVASYGGPRMPADVGSVASSYLGLPDPGNELARLLLADGQGGFVDAAEDWNLDRPVLTMGSNFGDLDNDGWLDFYLGTGYPYYEGLMPNVMYRNRSGASFSDVTTAAGFGHLQKGHAVVFADLDHDGDQDVFEQMGGTYPGDAFGNALYHNPGFGNHWIKIRLVGTRSNRSAIGARLRFELIDGGRPRTLYHHVDTGGSFGVNPLRREIGLGRAERIERLEVYWPASDTRQVFENVPVDRMIEIVEGQKSFREIPLRRLRFADAPG